MWWRAAGSWRNSWFPIRQGSAEAEIFKRASLLIFVAGFAAGFIPWKVTAPVRWGCRTLFSPAGRWQWTIGDARWIPWSRLEVARLQLQTPDGRRLQVDQLRLQTHLLALIGGRWETRWIFGPIRIEPSSWGIRAPLAREILSAAPVATDGFAQLTVGWGQVTLQELELHGSLIRLEAEGKWFPRRAEADLSLQGSVAGNLLQGLELEPGASSPRPWEPFDLRLRGPLARPKIRFDSNFYTLSSGEWEG